MSAEEALETLCQLFPTRERAQLARYLAASQNSVERAFAAVERGSLDRRDDSERPPKRKRTHTTGLGAWLAPTPKRTTDEVLVLDDSDPEPPNPAARPGSRGTRSLHTRASESKLQAQPVRSAFDLLKPSRDPSLAATPANPAGAATHVNLPPLTLRSANMVAKHTQGLVTLVEDALPQELASRLYVNMVRDSLGEREGENPCASLDWMPHVANPTVPFGKHFLD